MPERAFLFTLGAAASLTGDHSHVATGTTEYLTDAVPFIWSSPIWFPLLVGVATASLAELRLRLRAPRTSVTARQGLAGVAAVIGIYIITALEHAAPAVPVMVLIYALAAITWCVLGDGPGAVCGALAAIGGPIVEAVLAEAGVFRYADDSDALFGVAPWLPALYFAFGVVVAVLAEIAAKDRQLSVRSSVSGTPAPR
ncbi:MAG: hypothetical protein QOJ20_2590 [Mycobacterium sp.]|nr:hypothetical protein [Mycobacterium sp.]